ncbi:hypothetical protein KY285_029912 [Solanum tuberosum]|nr:hypothetical protein KY285_029912 [Solanum tuberosum]
MNKISGIQEQALKASTNTCSSNYRGRGRGRGQGRGRGDFKSNTDQSQSRVRDHDKSKCWSAAREGLCNHYEKGYDPVRGAIAIVQMSSNRLFPLKIDSIQSCLMAEVNDSTWMWPFRYGNLSFGGLKTLQQKKMVTDLPQIDAPSRMCCW